MQIENSQTTHTGIRESMALLTTKKVPRMMAAVRLRDAADHVRMMMTTRRKRPNCCLWWEGWAVV
jgi:hypothetical protein